MKPAALLLAAPAAALALALACHDSGTAPTPPAPRSYLMGFSAFPPSDTANVVTAINTWATRADAAIIHQSPPWTALINGTPATAAVDTLDLPLATYFRAKGLKLVYTVDATDGLDRAAEAPELVALGRSITDTAIQRLYREWVFAVAKEIHPDYLGLVAETNLIRAAAPDSVYQACVTMAGAAAQEIQDSALSPILYVSIQAEVAWGMLGGSGTGTYAGIAQDLADFPFVQAIGISSYPYLGGFSSPAAIPLDYYSRLARDAARPVLVVEGGWPSIPVQSLNSSPQIQADYIARQAQLLDSAHAAGVFQLTFYDLDLPDTLPPGSILPLFTHLGLADSAMHPKPALTTWDGIFHRPYGP